MHFDFDRSIHKIMNFGAGSIKLDHDRDEIIITMMMPIQSQRTAANGMINRLAFDSLRRTKDHLKISSNNESFVINCDENLRSETIEDSVESVAASLRRTRKRFQEFPVCTNAISIENNLKIRPLFYILCIMLVYVLY